MKGSLIDCITMLNVRILALTAVNLEEKYLSCVPHFIDYWLTMQSIRSDVSFEPKVIVVADQLPDHLSHYSKWCELYINSNEVSSIFVSQFIRLLKPSLQPSDFVVTTDVDMLPLNPKIFLRALDEIDQGAQVVICRDVLATGQYPICYTMASPTNWGRVTGVSNNALLEKKLHEAFRETLGIGHYRGIHGGVGWFVDQETLFNDVIAFEQSGGRVKRMADGDTGHRRLDRLWHPFPINWLLLPLVLFGFFTDYHVHHPVRKNQRFVRAVFRVLKVRIRFLRSRQLSE